ncbi:MAG TPA: ATP-binding protein [Syntrophobacteraceae bacterium]|nr:ATP-binding protein [Syntrophobacteraceae bacterium]
MAYRGVYVLTSRERPARRGTALTNAMNAQDPTDTKWTERRRFWERILVCAAFILLLTLGLSQGWFFKPPPEAPLYGNILLVVFINLNVLLLLLLAYLVLRNFVKLIFERKRNILGSKLKTRLVAASVALTLIPAVPLFWFASHFISSSLDNWFSATVQESLEDSVKLAREYVDRERSNLVSQCGALIPEAARMITDQQNAAHLESGLAFLFAARIDAAYVFNSSGDLKWSFRQNAGRPIDTDLLKRSFQKQSGTASRIISLPDGATPRTPAPRGTSAQVDSGPTPATSAIVASIPLESLTGDGSVLIALRFLPEELTAKLGSITAGYDNYLQLKKLHRPLKKSHLITFSIVTMLAIFLAVWFGFYLSKNLTGPIRKLLAATRQIADGDLEVRLDPDRQDEIGMLMTSFNNMVEDLSQGRRALDDAYNALKSSNIELEDRRRYMEVVLKNIAAGVVSVDAEGKITTMNNSAEVIFGVRAEEARGKHYSAFLDRSHMEIVDDFISSYMQGRHAYIERPALVKVAGAPMSLFVKVSILRDDRDQFMGLVAVLDDFTELEKAQRMTAWREVARRIAHEIKNPLTPIQLSAQRLRRKYHELVDSDGSVFDECTRTIIQQVDHMKSLVNEFSRFARLPRAKLEPCSLYEIVEEGLGLYRHNYSHISFALEKLGDMPALRLDRDQFRQVIINLIENSVHAIGSEHGEISIRLSFDRTLKIARLECADTGHGIAPENRQKVFEPYYSTKEKGAGLGLAIVSSIVADHNGFIRVRANEPRGTVFTVELPG